MFYKKLLIYFKILLFEKMSSISSDFIDIYIVLITEIEYSQYDEIMYGKKIEKPHIFNTNEKAMNYAYERAKKYAIERIERAKQNYSEYNIDNLKKNSLKRNFDENDYEILLIKPLLQYMPNRQRKYNKMDDIIKSFETMSEIDDLKMSNEYYWNYHSVTDEDTNEPEYKISVYSDRLDLK